VPLGTGLELFEADPAVHGHVDVHAAHVQQRQDDFGIERIVLGEQDAATLERAGISLAFGDMAPPVLDIPEGLEEGAGKEGLGNEVVRAGAGGVLANVVPGVGGKEDDGLRAGGLAKLAGLRHAVHAGALPVHDHEAVGLACLASPDQRQGFGQRRCRDRLDARLRQHAADLATGFPSPSTSSALSRLGSKLSPARSETMRLDSSRVTVAVKAVPLPFSLSAVIVPCMSSTMFLVMARPRPVLP